MMRNSESTATSTLRRRFPVLLAVLLSAPALSPVRADGAVAPPRVTYVSSSSVYVSAGSEEGVSVGDRLAVVRDGAAVAELEVTLTSPHKADCKRVGDGGEILAGDTVLLASATEPATPAAATPQTQPARGPSELGIRGRVGVRYLAIQDGGDGPDYHQPSLDVRIDGTRIAGSDFDVNADLRARRTYRTFGDGTSQEEGRTRLYRLSAAWQREGSPFRVSLGRQISPSLAVVSLFDGVLGEFRKDRWGAGLFGGTEPDPANYAYSSDVRDWGGFFEYGSVPGAERRWAITTGAVSSSEEGTINRDFFFLQGRYNDRRLSGYLTQEVDMNRGWRKEQEGSTWTATSTFATLRWRAAEAFSLNGGIDTRRSVRLYRDYVSPETEFDDRYRQGAWVGADGRFGKHFDYGVSYRRSDAGGDDTADSTTLILGLRRLTAWGLDLRARSTRYTNLHMEGWLHSLSASADLGTRSRLEAYGGVRDETVLEGAWVPEERHTWYGLNWDLFLHRHWMFTATAEKNQGQEEDNTQYYATVSYRF